MPRAVAQEIVYVLVQSDDQGLGTVEVHGTRSQAEFAAEAIARVEGYSTKDSRFHGTGELICVKHGRAVRTGIFVLPRQILRKPRRLKEKMTDKGITQMTFKELREYARKHYSSITRLPTRAAMLAAIKRQQEKTMPEDNLGRCEKCGKITPEDDLELIYMPGYYDDEMELWCGGCRDEVN